MSEVSPYLSVVVPLYNEEDNVQLLVERIQAVCQRFDFSSELILVDDGSSDNTVAIARRLVDRYPNLRIVVFRRNFGQTPAMVAGLQEARGSVLVTLDGDLQNDPEDIPAFIEKIEAGYPLVVGWRANRQDKLITRKIPSKVANWLIGRVTGVPIKDNGCSLKAYRADVIKQIPLYSEMHRFIPAMASIAGTQVYELEVRHHARQFGESKYGLSRVYKVAIDLIGIRALLTAARHPSGFFAWPALSVFLPGLLLAASGYVHDSLVFISTGLLLICSGLILSLYGLLTELLVSTGNTSSSDLAQLNQITTGSLSHDQ